MSIPAQLYYVPWRISATYHCRDIFPVLANFENYGDRYLWGSNLEAELTYPRIDDSPDGDGYVLRLTGEPESHWPGASMRRFPEDWSGYSTLKLDVRQVDAPTDTVKFSLRLDDYEGVRELVWIAQSFHATREWQTFTMPIADRQLWNSDRNLNLGEMDRLIIYFSRPQATRTIEIDNLRIE